MAHIPKFIFDEEADPHKNDTVIGCIQEGQCAECVMCGISESCRYSGMYRWEVA
jgi:hypothetical protein